MEPFDLESEISSWKRGLLRWQQLEPGDIVELETHLRDAIDDHLRRGKSVRDAFDVASASINRGFDDALDEFRFRSANQEPKPRLFAAASIPALLPNILKVTLRAFKRQPGYSIINVTGLAIGIAACFIIFLYVRDELSYDRFNEKAERTYRVDQTNIWGNFDGRFSSTGPGIASVLTNGLPEIETVVRINNPPDWLVTVQTDSEDVRYFEEPRVLSADSTFFDVFTMDFVEGNPSTALDAPFSVVITDKTRRRYFGDNAALGKSIRVGNPGEEVAYQITGVVQEMPRNAHFRFDLLESLSSNANLKRRPDAWVWTVFVTYVVLKPDASIVAVRRKLARVVAPHAEAKLYSAFGTNESGLRASGKTWELFLTPLTEIHLRSLGAGNRIGVVSDILYVYVFSVVALLIIALASINFMNLSSARSVYRAKEVGIRKTLGSRRSTLIGQFLSESVLFSFIALVLAIVIVFFAIGPFNDIAQKRLSLADLFAPELVAGMVGFAIVVGLLSGAYPALFLTSFSPIQALRSRADAIARNRLSLIGLRNGLVVFQFVISILLISCSVIIHQQLSFVQSKNLGFDKENVLVLENIEKIGEQAETFKQVIAREPGVVSVAQSNAVPPRIWYEDFAAVYGGDGPEIALNSLVVDDDVVSTLGFDVLRGHSFEKDNPANKNYVVLNQSAVQRLPWPEGVESTPNFPLGQSILFSGDGVQYEVIGVVRDFNTYSLREPIQPLALFHITSGVWKGPNRFLSIRVATNADVRGLIDRLRNRWKAAAGLMPFDYGFLDEQLYQQYESEQKVASIVGIFTALAIFIAVLGLLGLVSFVIEKKTKEIGVRKVLGATSTSIVLLLFKDLSRLILVAAILAVPLGWMMMDRWLQGFTFRVDISPVVFVGAGFAALLVAWVALGWQTVKAATRNPVLSLRSE